MQPGLLPGLAPIPTPQPRLFLRLIPVPACGPVYCPDPCPSQGRPPSPGGISRPRPMTMTRTLTSAAWPPTPTPGLRHPAAASPTSWPRPFRAAARLSPLAARRPLLRFPVRRPHPLHFMLPSRLQPPSSPFERPTLPQPTCNSPLLQVLTRTPRPARRPPLPPPPIPTTPGARRGASPPPPTIHLPPPPASRRSARGD